VRGCVDDFVSLFTQSAKIVDIRQEIWLEAGIESGNG